MSSSQNPFQPGDQVRHPQRPEWGIGRVERVDTVTHDGQPAYRTTVRFPNKGQVTIHSAFATLLPPDNAQANQGWLAALENKEKPKDLGQLPDTMTDPLKSLPERFAHSLMIFRFPRTPRGLIDWAIAQTGLTDPLANFPRHELEQTFDRFFADAEDHLKSLFIQMIRQGRREQVDNAKDNPRTPEPARILLQRWSDQYRSL